MALTPDGYPLQAHLPSTVPVQHGAEDQLERFSSPGFVPLDEEDRRGRGGDGRVPRRGGARLDRPRPPPDGRGPGPRPEAGGGGRRARHGTRRPLPDTGGVGGRLPAQRGDARPGDLGPARCDPGRGGVLRAASRRRAPPRPCRRHGAAHVALHPRRGGAALGHPGWGSRHVRARGEAPRTPGVAAPLYDDDAHSGI